jgi:hypothetical protein
VLNRLLAFCLILSGLHLFAYVPVQAMGIQYQVVNRHLQSRFWGEHYFAALPGTPSLPAPRFFSSSSETIWDGQFLVRGGNAADGKFGLELGRLAGVEPDTLGWTFTEPCWLPPKSRLLGAWNGKALVEVFQKHEPGPASQGAGNLRSLWLVDASTGQSRSVFAFPKGPSELQTSAVLDGEVYLFSGYAGVLVFRFEDERTKVIAEDLWHPLNLTLCSKLGDLKNPGIDGPAFFDPEGMVLFPIRPLLVLDREDTDRAWAKMGDAQRNQLILEGVYPFDPAKGLGWKAKAGFVQFNPKSGQCRLVERRRFATLVEDVETNFIKTEFVKGLESGQVFATDGSLIKTLEQAQADGDAYRQQLAESKR